MEIIIAIVFATASLFAAVWAYLTSRPAAAAPAAAFDDAAGGGAAAAGWAAMEDRLPLIRIDAAGAVAASSAARRMLGLPAATIDGDRDADGDGGAGPGAGDGARAGLDLASLTARATDGAAALQAALAALVDQGTAFREVVELDGDRLIEVTGAPLGVDVGLTLSDQTEARRASISARIEAENGRAELRDLRAAQAAAGVYSWRSEASGAVRWRSDGFAGLPAATRRALIAEAESPDLDRSAALRGRASVFGAGAEDAARVVIDGVHGEEAFHLATIDRDAEGGVLHVASDIGAVVKSERAMERLVYTMSETFAHLKVGLMIFDAEMRLTLFNPAIIEIFGDEGDWMARRPHLRDLLDRLRHSRRLPERLDFAAWRATILALASEETPETLEEIWHLPDGRSLMALFRPHPSGGLAFVVEDVTESMSLRRTNSSERAVSQATTDMLEEGVAVFGPDGRLSMANGALRRIWDLSGDLAATGTHVSEMIERWRVATGPHPFWTALLGAATHGRDRVAAAHKLPLADGRLLSARLSPMPDGSSLAVFGDATADERVADALKERNEALEHADEMRSALIDQISHQMRTPLNSVLGLGQLLGDRRFGDLNDTQRDYVDGIIDSCTDLLDAINGMADLITVGVQLEDEPDDELDMRATLEEVVALASRQLKERAPKVEIRCDAAATVVAGRRSRLRQILSNMLMDAAAKSPDGAGVVLSLAVEADELVVACVHEMAAEVDESGLALSLIRRFARIAGGEAEVIAPLPPGDEALEAGADLIDAETACGADAGRREIRCRLPMAPEAAPGGAGARNTALGVG